MGKLKTGWIFIAVFCSSTAAAVEWTVTPSVLIAETYTDNLELDPDNLKTDEFVTEILPAIEIGAVGKRFEVDFEYRLQSMLFSRRDDLDETLSYAKTNGKAALIGNTVFVDFNGSLNQQIINPGGRTGTSGINPGNRSEVLYYSVNPYWQKQFGSGINMRVGYQHGAVEYGEDMAVASSITLTDNKSNGVIAAFSVAPPRAAWSWRADIKDSTIDYEDGAKVDLKRIGGELAWSFGKTAIYVGGGDEDNAFNQLVGTQKIDGSFWHVGLRGQLDRLTTYSISAGEQHFGDSYQFSLERQAGQLTTDISYLEETTTVGQQQQGYEALFEFLSNITGSELPTPGAEVYVRKRLSAVGTLQLGKSRLKLNAYNENRDYLTTFLGGSDGISGVALSWTWTALPRTELSLDAGWQAFELRTSQDNPEDLRLQVRVKRDLSKGLSFNVRAWTNRRGGAVPENEYDSIAVSLGIGKRF